MASYITIEFDTTSPQIEIYAPRYTTKDVVNEITIQANEELSNFQEIYAIDSLGNKHEYTFQQEEDNKYVGLIRFNNFPYGIATIYARMKDEVDNYSTLTSKAIEVKESFTSLNLKISEKNRLIENKSSSRQNENNIINRATDIRINLKNDIKMNIKERKVDIQTKRGE